MATRRDSQSTPAPRNRQGTALAGAILATIGWVGIYLLLSRVLPYAGARWAFFVMLYLAVAGTSVPILRMINHRFQNPPPPDWIAVRQALWVGLYVTTCAWLQIPRVLNPIIAFFLALSLAVIEIFLRVREKNLHGY